MQRVQIIRAPRLRGRLAEDGQVLDHRLGAPLSARKLLAPEGLLGLRRSCYVYTILQTELIFSQTYTEYYIMLKVSHLKSKENTHLAILIGTYIQTGINAI